MKFASTEENIYDVQVSEKCFCFVSFELLVKNLPNLTDKQSRNRISFAQNKWCQNYNLTVKESNRQSENDHFDAFQ